MQEEATAKNNERKSKPPPPSLLMAAQNPNFISKPSSPSKVREEGELSSSDYDDVLPTSSVPPLTVVSASSISAPNVFASTNVQGMNSGNSVAANRSARSAEVPSQKVAYHKGFNKSKVLLKSKNSVWRASDANSNLVISFSDDDDSSSDDGKRRQKKSAATARLPGPPPAVKGSRKPPALLNVKLDAESERKERKVAAKKVSLSRTFISSMNKIHGSGVSTGVPLAQQRSWLKRPNLGRISPNRDLRCNKNVEPGSRKLQDLRQRIAMCENELKRKLVQKSKGNVSETCQEVDVVVRNKDTLKDNKEVPSDKDIGPKEPDRKRLKMVSSCFERRSSTGLERPSSSGYHLKPAELTEPLPNNSACQDQNIIDVIHHESGNSLRDILPCPDGGQGLLTSQRKGSDMPQDDPWATVNCRPSDLLLAPRETSTLPMPTLALTNSISAGHLDKSSELSKSQGVVYKNHPSTSAANRDTNVNNIIKVNDHHSLVPESAKSKSASYAGLQSCSSPVLESKLGSPDAYPDSMTLLRSLSQSRVLGCNEVDVQSLFEIEELHDKELEEAQEHRQRCEVEERNALKAYRRAQRALADANAHCAYLYRRRELYSAQLRSLVMEDSSLLWSSSQQRQIGDTSNLVNTMVDGDLNLIPTSTHHTQAEFEAGNQLGYDSNAQSADGDAHAMFSGNEYGHNLGSEACSEPDASSSELLAGGNSSAVNGVHPQSGDQNLSPEDDNDGGAFLQEHRSVYANVASLREEENRKENENIDVDSTTNFSGDGLQDPLLLEAYLRSKLFSRLEMADSSKQNGNDANCKLAVNKVSEEDVAGANECSKESEGCKFKPPSNIQNWQNVKEHSSNESPISMLDPEDSGFHVTYTPFMSVIPSSSIFKSAMKSAGCVSSDSMNIAKEQSGSPDACNEEDLPVQCDQDTDIGSMGYSIEVVPNCVSFGKVDSYSGKSTIDLSWPLCIFELRGKCNNDECPWQHVKDYSSDCKNESLSNRTMQRGCTQPYNILTPPRYLVCMDTLKAESHCSLQERQLVSTQKNVFSISLAVSSSLLKHLCSDGLYLHGNDGCVESYGSGYPLYFHCRNGTGSSRRNGTTTTGDDQALETALIMLNQVTNKNEGTKKALSELSRALEADPFSLPLWIIYLVLYHSTKSSKFSRKAAFNEDDFFSCAVKHNEGSYELWLLYINSRGRLNDQFAAYERALSSLCHHASENSEHVVYKSAAILDLSLQMFHSFCMSGNVAMAVQRIYRLILTDRDLDESHSLLLSDILECLTISDKCIFWICCAYLVIYRKLPDEMVQQFEFPKDNVILEWPAIRLTLEGNQIVSRLMEVAFDSLGLHMNNKSLDSNSLKPVHLVAVNHAKLMLAIDGKETYMVLLDRYRNSYPFCLELILLSARARADVGETANYEGFEDALQSWPNEVPGIQCIWNQFVQYVIQNGKIDMAKEIMDKWFNSVWKPQFVHNTTNDVENGDKISSEDPLSGSMLNDLLSSDKTVDLVFGLLNFSLYKLLQNDVSESRLAIDKALSLADSEVILHFVGEHAVFLLNYGPQLDKDVSVHRLPDILKAYMIHEQAIPSRDPLTWKFVKDIPKPRLRQLVSKILCPISPHSRLVNSVLDIWFGSTLLPQNTNSLKDLVDFVEPILEFSPANYHLVVSVCRLLCSGTVFDNAKSESVLFWASSLLVNTIYHALPIPPEYVWMEAADLLGKLTNVPEISVSFHKRALSVYPFSLRLWKSYLNLSTSPSKKSIVVEAARDKGIKLD